MFDRNRIALANPITLTALANVAVNSL